MTKARAALPSTIEPLKPTLVREVPTSDEWLHEIKYDGYRLVCFLDRGVVRLQTKNLHDWTKRFPELATAIRSLPAKSAILDGELTALRPNGIASIGELHAAFRNKESHRLVLFAFDLLYLDDEDLRQRPLIERK